jgi:hypothetical protein
MKNLLCLLPLFLLALGGCASTAPKLDPNKVYNDYISQQRVYSALTLRTTDTTVITIKGEVELTMDSPLQPLSARSSDPSTAQAVVSGAERAIKAVALGYFANEAIGSLSESRDPLVVEQPPPLVITTPTAP